MLDDDGQPAQDVRVEFTNIGFVSGAEELQWYGYTDDDGMIRPELPAGEYSAITSARQRDYDRWLEPVVTLGEAPLVLDPGPQLRDGHLDVPGSVRVRDFRLEITATLEFPYRELTFLLRANPDVDGDLSIPWYGDVPHQVDLTGPFQTRVRLHDELALAPQDSILLEWNPDEFQVRLTLGGEPMPPSSVAVTSRTPGSQVRGHEIQTRNSVASFLGYEGIGEITIESTREEPFLPYLSPFEFRLGQMPTIELGDFRVELEFRTSAGEELYGCTLEIREATSGIRSSRRATEPRKTFFLRPGNYRMTANLEGLGQEIVVASVSSDTTFTFVLDPEEP